MQLVGHHHLPVQSALHRSVAVLDAEACEATGSDEQHRPVPLLPQSAPVESECWQQ